MTLFIDLNSDLGESFGSYTMGQDSEILSQVTSANIACGWHAGDPIIMNQTVEECKRKGVAVGAHPGYPDLMGFGRRKMSISPEEATAYIVYQLGALQGFAQLHGLPVQHVKMHGAFYNTVCITPALADAVLAEIEAFDPSLRLMVLSGSYIAKEGRRRGLRICEEVFADRGVTDSGELVPRNQPGAFIKESEEALFRVIQMLTKGTVTTNTGKEIEITADSVCVHGDSPTALAFAIEIRQGLEREGIAVTNFLNRL